MSGQSEKNKISVNSHKSNPYSVSQKYLLGFSPAFEDEDVGVNVLHTDPAGQRQRGVSPDPVHHSPQLREEGHQAKTVDNIQKFREQQNFILVRLCTLATVVLCQSTVKILKTGYITLEILFPAGFIAHHSIIKMNEDIFILCSFVTIGQQRSCWSK